ncbi:MAG: hypothetical protein AAB316_25335, partial [Bacteroidota bacterium]
MKNHYSFYLAFVCHTLLGLPVFSQPLACLDQTFGTDGVLKIESGCSYELAKAISYQSNGCLIMGGIATWLDINAPEDYFFLQRYLPNGSVDFTFGVEGKAWHSKPSNLNDFFDLLVLPNDDIIISVGYGNPYGDPTLIKFSANGTLDTLFAQNGRYKIPGNPGEQKLLLATLPGGKFMAGGASQEKVLLARFHADASPDSTFGNQGTLTQPSNFDFDAEALAINADSSIFLGGSMSLNLDASLLMKFKPNGSPDLNFGIGGKILTPFPMGSNPEIHAIAIAADSSIFTLGARNWASNQHLVIAKFKHNGSSDLTFNAQGYLHETYPNTQGEFNDLLLLPNGNLLAGGRLAKNMAIIQYLPSGTRASGFGVNGLLETNYGLLATNEIMRFLAHPASGKVFALGFTDNQGDMDIALMQLDDAGNLDAAFGEAGKMLCPVFSANEEVVAFERQPDGKLILVLSSLSTNGNVLLRLLPNGKPDRTFGNFGKITFDDFTGRYRGCIKIHEGKILLATNSIYSTLIRLTGEGLPDPG